VSGISVRCEPSTGGHRCTVVVGDDPKATTHEVTVSGAALERLTPASTATPAHERAEALVRASFAYLLEREPRESILRSFDLPVIERYFPGYEREIGSRVATLLQGVGPDADRA
jgi:hypothetical protein